MAAFLERQITAPGIIRLISPREARAFLILSVQLRARDCGIVVMPKNDSQGLNLSTLLPPAHPHALQFLMKENLHPKRPVAVTRLSAFHVGLTVAVFLKENVYGQM